MATATLNIGFESQHADVNGNGGSSTLKAPELEKQLSDLTSSLSAFKTALTDFKNVTKSQTTDSKQQQQRFVEEQRTARANLQKDKAAITASVQTNPDVINQRRIQAESSRLINLASSTRNQNASELLNIGKQQLTGGDARWGKELIDRVADSTSKGTAKALSDKNLWQAIGAVGSLSVISSANAGYRRAQTQIGLTSLNNPMANGYDYGGTVASLINLSEQKNASILGAGATLVGSAIGGAIGGIKGATIGGATGEGLSAPIISYELGKTAIKSKALGDYVNNRMQIEALRGTNAPAYNIQQSAMKGRQLTDIEVPFITTIAKGIGVYNNNFKAVQKLTNSIVNFSQSAQLDIGTASQVSGAAGLLSRTKGFDFEKTKQLFNTYGTTDYAGGLSGAVNFAQAGFNPQKAVEMSLQYQSMNPGFQAAAGGFYGNSLGRAQGGLVARAFGGNPEALYDANNKGHGAAVSGALNIRNKYLQYIKSGDSANAILQANLYSLQTGGADITQAPLFDMQKRDLINKPVGTTGVQAATLKTIDQQRSQALNGTLDINKAANDLVQLGTGATNVSQSFGGLTNATNSLTAGLNMLTKLLLHNYSNMGINSNSTGSTQSKNH